MGPGHRAANRVSTSLGIIHETVLRLGEGVVLLTKGKASSSKHICLSCRRSIVSQRSSYATAATATTPPELTQSANQLIPPHTSAPPTTQPAYTINAGVVLSRAPILTPDTHPFETAYYLYQRRLNERLVLPFTQYFYYKPNTPAFDHWRVARKARNGVAARDVGGYNAHNEERWNDEALVGDKAGEQETVVRQLIQEEGKGKTFAGESGREDMAGLRRRTEADERGDVRSLERALSRTLYLLVKRKRMQGKEGEFWSFPSGTVEGKEGLKEVAWTNCLVSRFALLTGPDFQAAERILYSSCGPNMNTWFVGNHPVGHYVYKIRNPARFTQSDPSSTPASRSPLAGEKTFFMKSRIFQGQADPRGNQMGVEDFKWLSKEEIQSEVSPRYWASIRNMLVEP